MKKRLTLQKIKIVDVDPEAVRIAGGFDNADNDGDPCDSDPDDPCDDDGDPADDDLIIDGAI